MRKVMLLIALLATSTAFAKTHDYDMKAPCGHVWAAVREVIMHSGKYGVLYMNDKDLTASYNIGGGLSGRRTNTVQLISKEGGCTMSVQTAFSGLVNKDAGDFRSRIEDALKKVPPPKPEEAGAAESAAQPESKATLEISSNPTGADIELDGNFSGNTPSSLGVSPGEHTIKVTKRGYKPWERKVTTSSGTVKIAPELEAETAQETKPQ
jgi:PEGA domain